MQGLCAVSKDKMPILQQRHNHQDNIQMRVSGEVELREDLQLKKEIVASPGREFLKPMIAAIGYESCAVYQMKKGSVSLWTFATNFAPKEYFDFL